MADKPNYEIFQNKSESESHEPSQHNEDEADFNEPSIPPITQAVKVLP